MQRVTHLKKEDLEWAARTTAESRLRQANCAFRLFHDVHEPFAEPFIREFDSVEEFFRFELEHGFLGRPLPS